ncbi:hypothetical protein [Alteromonas sp.]|nr:hypothetical protein [Alteromonas sp.]
MPDYNRLINNAMNAHNRAQSEWAKKFWLEVATKLTQNVQKH